MDTLRNYKKDFRSTNFYFAHSLDPSSKMEDYYRHIHTRYELYVFFDGEADFVIENKPYRLVANTALIIPPHAYHYASIRNSNKPYHRLIINFDRNFIFPEMHSLLDSGTNPFEWSERHTDLLEDLEKNLSRYRSCDGALLTQFFLNRLLMDFKYARSSPSPQETLNSTVTEILAFINEHIREPLQLRSIAEQLFLNPSYLSQLFASNMKIGLMDYIKQKKIYLADDMIRNGKIPPTEASKQLGFNDYSTFYRLYKKYFRQAPSSGGK